MLAHPGVNDATKSASGALDDRESAPSSPRGGELETTHEAGNLLGWIASNNMFRAVALILAWYFFSMGLSLYNKVLIGQNLGHFPAPLLMTTFHFLLQYVFSTFLLHCVCPSWAPPSRLSCRDYNLRIIPTALATALDIGLSNLSLAFITLTFYTMCKSSAPVFLLVFAFIFRLEAASLQLMGVVGVISVGVLFTVAGESQFQLLGFLLVMGSSITSGLRWVLIQVLLQKDKLGLTNPLVTLSYLTPIMALLCAVFSLLHEPWHMLHQTIFFDTWQHTLRSTLIMVLGGCLAFFMILAEFLLVLETSAVTFSVAGTVKEGATILVSHLVFGDRFTRINLVGIFIIMIGVSLFHMYKFNRHAGERPKPGGSQAPRDGGSEGLSGDEGQHLISPHYQTAAVEGAQTAVHHHKAAAGGTPSPRPPPEVDEVQVLVATAMTPRSTPSPGISSPPSPSMRSHVELIQRLTAAVNERRIETVVEEGEAQ